MTEAIQAPDAPDSLIPTGGKKYAPIQLIRDLESTSGFWAAVWTICCLPDAHVICDAPIGCFNLVGTAVPDYTDAVPHIENLTPSVMREQEVTMTGTAPAVRRVVDALREIHPDREIIVVSTAESDLPYDNVKDAGGLKDMSSTLTAARNLNWKDDARSQMESHLENIPWLSRISATRELRTNVEQYAVKNNLNEVTIEVVEKALANA